MSVMLGDIAVEEVVVLLNNTALPCFKGRAYKYEKRENVSGEYIAVNHLPFVHRGEVEEGTVNVNIHVPKTRTNEPDTKRLSTLATAVAELFPKNTLINGAYYEFYADSRPVLDGDGTYYVNLQLNVTFNDLQYN